MCPPKNFVVEYAINAWMDTTVPVDTELAVKQWHVLRDTVTDLGHQVHFLDRLDGLPDMVFAANGAFSVDGVVYGAIPLSATIGRGGRPPSLLRRPAGRVAIRSSRENTRPGRFIRCPSRSNSVGVIGTDAPSTSTNRRLGSMTTEPTCRTR